MHPLQVICDLCDDSGWQSFECDGQPGVGACERWQLHEPHRFVRPCPCREGNAAYQRNVQRGIRRPKAAA